MGGQLSFQQTWNPDTRVSRNEFYLIVDETVSFPINSLPFATPVVWDDTRRKAETSWSGSKWLLHLLWWEGNLIVRKIVENLVFLFFLDKERERGTIRRGERRKRMREKVFIWRFVNSQKISIRIPYLPVRKQKV